MNVVINIGVAFIIGFVIGIVAALAHNASAPDDNQTHVPSSALSTAIIIVGIPLLLELLKYLNYQIPSLLR